MSYARVLPRDLFNESKLLKGLGQLTLLIHNGLKWPLTVEHNHTDAGFAIGQHQSDGSTYCHNVTIRLHGKALELSSPLNCRSPFPMTLYDDAEGELPVFNEDGSLADEFTEFMEARCGTISSS
jgi:hypothetical protein